MLCPVSYVTLPILAPTFPIVSDIRETLVKMFAGSVRVQHSDSGDYSATEHFGTIIAADNELHVDPSTCVFWCAVALGSLVKGRPIESVRNGVQCLLLCRQESIVAVNHTQWLIGSRGA